MLSMIRTGVAEQLRASERTKHCVSVSRPVGIPMNCEGAEKGTVIGRITHKTTARLLFREARFLRGGDDSSTGGNAAYRAFKTLKPGEVREVDTTFCELERLADPIIIGCPELMEWGFYLEPDLDGSGLGYVQFAYLGIALPLCGTRVGTKVNVIRAALLSGPDYVSVPVEALRQDIEGYRR